MSAKLEAKFPKAFEKSAGVRTYLSEVWKETFPNEELNVRLRMEKRKELAKLENKLTAEEIEAMQEEIPEWKRAAVTLVDSEAAVEEKKGFLSKQMGKISNKFWNT
jgi:predicted  nucleic acid-binding Zn-ribbon protein